MFSPQQMGLCFSRNGCCLCFDFAVGRNLVAHHQSPEPGGKALVVRLASACLQLQLCVGTPGRGWDEDGWTEQVSI